jgi:hypothetical protein
MTERDFTGIATTLAQIGKPRRILDSFVAPRVAVGEFPAASRLDYEKMFGLGKSSALEQLIGTPKRINPLFETTFEPSTVQSMIDQHKAITKMFSLGTNPSMLELMGSKSVMGVLPATNGSINFPHADFMGISEAFGVDRFKMQYDLFQGVADQLASMGSVLDVINVPLGFYKSLRVYEDGLLSRYAAGVVAEAEGVAAESIDVDLDEDGAVWFGAESWSALVWELVTILKVLELTTTGMWAAKGLLKAPVPIGILYVTSVALVAGELAGRLAERSAKRRDAEN